MEKRDHWKNQNHFPCRLIPLQNLKPEIKFCSLAELKTCLDSAQVNSLQKESKDSILKLLKGDTSTSESDKVCYNLWGGASSSKTSKDNFSKTKDKCKLEKPIIKQYESCTKIEKRSQIVDRSLAAVPPKLPKTAPCFPTKKTRHPAIDFSEYKEPPKDHQQSGPGHSKPIKPMSVKTAEKVYISDEDSSEDETGSENMEASTQGDFSSEFDYRFEDNNDEFDELSDLDADGDDSAVVSRCNSSISWTSLDNKQDEVSESVTTTDSGLGSDADISTHLPVTHSLFKHCPPVLYFPSEHEKLSKLPRAVQRQLKWKMSNITPNVVKNIIARAGFVASTKRKEWIGYWGKHMKASAFKNIHPHQKVNHFPGTFEIGRKDKLWKNLYKSQIKYSKKEFDFIPLTFCLPSEWKTFRRYWDENGHKQKWIVKPPASARGIGIKVIHKLNQIPRKRNVIIQRYLSNPYLINGRKFDLRIYVYVSSYDPLCIYMYDNGLVRFASSKYSHSSKTLSNRYMHLTNYSVNKNNEAYIKNEDESGTESHKWGLKALWKYLLMAGQDVELLKTKIKNIITKVIIASVPTVTSLSKSNCRFRDTCHELFGFDIFLDHHLKPWLIEVNISPSLHTSAPLDKHIKSGLIKDLFNIAGFHVPTPSSRSKSSAAQQGNSAGVNRSTQHSSNTGVKHGSAASRAGVTPDSNDNLDPITDAQLYFNPGINLTSDEKAKHAYFSQKYVTDVTVADKILDTLTPDDVRVLMKFEDEISRKGELELIFPTENSTQFLKYFQFAKFYDLLVIQWLKKNSKDPQRGVARLQKLAESKVQFTLHHSTAEHVWCKQNFRNMKRAQKIRDYCSGSKLFTPRVPLPVSQRTSATPSKMSSLSTPSKMLPLTSPCSPASRSRPARSPRSAPAAPRTPNGVMPGARTCSGSRTCTIITDQGGGGGVQGGVTHFPTVDWQSNYSRAQRSLNKLKLVKFNNWEVSGRGDQGCSNNNSSLVTNWVSHISEL